MTFDSVRGILLDELQHKGYVPNPGDLTGAVTKILALSQSVQVVVPGAKAEAPAVPAVVESQAAPVKPPK
jgi:hypothetical protein